MSAAIGVEQVVDESGRPALQATLQLVESRLHVPPDRSRTQEEAHVEADQPEKQQRDDEPGWHESVPTISSLRVDVRLIQFDTSILSVFLVPSVSRYIP